MWNCHPTCGHEVNYQRLKKNPRVRVHTMATVAGISGVKGNYKVAVKTTPRPLCQTNVEMHQDAINKKFGTNYKIPVVFYSQLMAVAFGMDAYKDAALNQNIIRSNKPEQMATENKKG